MMQSIKNKLLGSYGNKASQLNLVKTKGGGIGKILFFAFLGRQKAPFLCVKASSLECYNDLIESEFNSLAAARNSLPYDLKMTIPEPLELTHINGHIVGLEECVSGRQAYPGMIFNDLEKVFNWLCQFHKANIVEKRTISKEFLSEVLSKYNLEGKTINNILEIWGDWSVEMPLIKQHGDFHFANVFFYGNALKIIDWANYGKVTLPAYDLLFFLRRQIGGIEGNKKTVIDYFNYFSIPEEVLEPWVKILGIVENLEKWSIKK